jgi:hypothetical protein
LLVSDVRSGASEFAPVGDTCSPAPVEPGATCTISVRYAPSAVGDRRGSVTLKANTATLTHVLALAGQGLAPTPHDDSASPTPTVTPTPAPPQVVQVVVAPKPRIASETVRIRFASAYETGKLPRARACRGTVRLELRRGTATLQRKSTRLSRRCRFGAVFAVARSGIGDRRTLTVVARFSGNSVLGATTNRFTIRVPAA